MSKTFTVSALWVLLFYTTPHVRAETAPIGDGLLLDAVAGTVDANGGTWFFTLDTDYVLGRTTVPAQTRLEILPCPLLAAMLRQERWAPPIRARIKAMVTQYRRRNYLLLLSPSFCFSAETPARVPSARPSDPTQGNALAVPDEVLSQMRNQRAENGTGAVRLHPETKDRLLLGRRGRLEREGDTSFLVLEGVGRNVSGERLRLLPCRARERLENQQARHADRLWFRISGKEIDFAGQTHLLLHQAVRLYGLGNLNGVDG